MPYVVVKSFSAEEDDLSCGEGDEITVRELKFYKLFIGIIFHPSSDDGWWFARKHNGVEGFVPSSCIQERPVDVSF